MTTPWTLYGQKGTGSVAVEAALTLQGIPYRLRETPLAGLVASDVFAKVNPMRQLPALILPSGELMTESAAILIWLADSHPDSGLAPKIEDSMRAAYLQWMAFVSSAIYALYWVRDDPSRLAADEGQAAVIKARTAERIAACWAVMEARTAPGRYLLGDRLTVLDLYVTVISRWGPRRRRFYEVAPRMGEVARRVDADPRQARLWAERFPFVEGW
ncbi:MAG: glutathione S-transferase family protein, partial [Pseudomonadota bacterium]|nr:glutathione S-transferase family protein [Pseudomonadota bacterium]